MGSKSSDVRHFAGPAGHQDDPDRRTPPTPGVAFVAQCAAAAAVPFVALGAARDGTVGVGDQRTAPAPRD
jgi:hypothetical protein